MDLPIKKGAIMTPISYETVAQVLAARRARAERSWFVPERRRCRCTRLFRWAPKDSDRCPC